MTVDAATQRQIDAANPLNSTWLSANAGSGKTRVLTDRVARLLLEAVEPQNILCLTYTKAAAAEMQNRLFKRLGAWAMMKDAALRADLETLGFTRKIDETQLKNARTLFARAIETPGGLKIQTIHSFCGGILRRFPLEAKISPQFREMEEKMSAKLRADVVDEMVAGNDAAVVHELLKHFTGDDLGELTAAIAAKQDAFLNPPQNAELLKSLDLQETAKRDDALSIAFSGHEVAISNDLLEAFNTATATYKNFAKTIANLNLENPDWHALDTLFKLFLYAKDSSSKSANYPQSNHSKAVDAMAPIADAVHDWMDRVAAARVHLWAMDVFERTQALYAFGTKFIIHYEAKKLSHGALDFDDLIRKAKELLIDAQVAQWVLFRLDGGIDHVLVDEAQDTSPNQWAVIERLTQEFATGEGARADRHRTIFVVGDKKQSIYSFQGADPEAFDQMRIHFQEGMEQIDQRLENMSLDHSFRSSQAILSVVDNTFVRERAEGMEKDVPHIAFKSDMPGRVDLWPPIEKAGATETESDWTDPVDMISDTHHTVLLANRIAHEIVRMIKEESIPAEIGNTGTYQRRPVNEGDILILVQRRSDIFAEVIRACKSAGLKIAGADRLRVGAELAVKDLAALLRFLALPEDDLSLACALRSPLFSWTEQELFTLAYHRPKSGYLWAALRNSETHSETLKILTDLRKQADFLRPFDLIERILTRHGGRHRLLARLGAEAEDGIDALLSQALSYETTDVPSLTGFLTWMETDDLEVKRQIDAKGDRIRVMTVHGAKGLEAPIVFLPDTANRQNILRSEIFPTNDHLIWKTSAATMPPSVKAMRDLLLAKQSKERMRLLYVAMTRAEKWLIVCAAGDIGKDGESWYNIVADGMNQAGSALAVSGGVEIQRVQHEDWHAPEFVQQPIITLPQVDLPVFRELTHNTPEQTLSPSQLGGVKALPGDPSDSDSEQALAYGRMVHLLLEHLPNISADARENYGIDLLQSNPDTLDDGDHGQLVIDAITLLNTPELAHIFTPDALAEVEITASLPALGNRRIHGVIDRLIISDAHILAVDFKTNRLVPDTPEAVPEGLLRQMGAYQMALAQIYPNKTIEVAILWTQSTNLMPLPSALITAALARVTTP